MYLGSEVICTSGNMAKGSATDKMTWDQISKLLISVSPPIETEKNEENEEDEEEDCVCDE